MCCIRSKHRTHTCQKALHSILGTKSLLFTTAQVNALAARYETTGDLQALAGVQFFFDTVTKHHGFTTGGTSDHEFWGPPDQIADAIWKNGDALVTQVRASLVAGSDVFLADMFFSHLER